LRLTPEAPCPHPYPCLSSSPPWRAVPARLAPISARTPVPLSPPLARSRGHKKALPGKGRALKAKELTRGG